MKYKEKILITGAGGFIGHHLARFLKAKGYLVRGADIRHPEFSDLSDFHDFKLLDLRDFRNMIEAMSDNIDKVYAFAADNGSIEYTTTVKADILRDNSIININTAEAATKLGVKRVFFSSSACVYPQDIQMKTKSRPLKESDVYPANPDSEYGWEKLFSERMYKSYEHDYGLETRIARFFNIYGPETQIDTLKSKAPMAITKKIVEAGNNGVVRIWGDGKQIRSFLYIDDCVEAVYKLMNSNIKEPLNIGTADHMSINELTDLIAKIEGVKIKKIHELEKIQGVRTRLCNTNHAQKLLNWKRKTTIRQGLIEVNKFVHQVIDKA